MTCAGVAGRQQTTGHWVISRTAVILVSYTSNPTTSFLAPKPMPKPLAKSGGVVGSRPSQTPRAGRPARTPGHERRQIVVDTSLLSEAMRLTGRGQSDAVNAALARMTENAAILDGARALFGAFPSHPDHADDAVVEDAVERAPAADDTSRRR